MRVRVGSYPNPNPNPPPNPNPHPHLEGEQSVEEVVDVLEHRVGAHLVRVAVVGRAAVVGRLVRAAVVGRLVSAAVVGGVAVVRRSKGSRAYRS